MKKSLLALAVLTAIAGAAQAQSSVTIYGKIDLGGVLDSGGANGKSVRIDSGVTGGSRLGFKGVEDLGGGYKAAFQLETGFCADSAAGDKFAATSNVTGKAVTDSAANFCTGSNNFMGRQAHGDLSGPFGAVSAGRQYSLSFLNITAIDPFGSGTAAQTVNIINPISRVPSATRLNNSVTYTTPSFAGFTASAEGSLGEVQGNWRAGRETGGAANYAAGPAYVSFVYFNQDNGNGVGTLRKNYSLGGTYDFGVVKLHAMVEKGTGSPTGLAKVDILDYMGGVTIPLGGGQLLGSVVHENDKTAADQDATQYGVGYMYPLSKRTSVYTAFAKINDRHNATFTVGNATALGTGDKAFNLGVVHNF
jgi:predicted porin